MLLKIPNTKLNENSSCESRCLCVHKDGLT